MSVTHSPPAPHHRPSTPARRPVARILSRIALLAALVVTGTAAAQQVTATLSPRTVAQGQPAEFAITYEGPQTSIESVPETLAVEGLDFDGPQTQQSFSLNNNVATFRFELIWQVSGSQPGRFTIPPQSVTIGGQVFTTNELVLEVREGPPPESSLEPLLQMTIARTELYVGEVTPITITALIHRRTQLRNYGHPKLPRENFVVKRFPPPGPAPTVEINGERYQPIIFSSSLSALREGDLSVGPATLDDVVLEFPADTGGGGRRTPPGFPPSFFQRMSARQLSLTSESIPVRVKPLPTEGRPADFAGAVGRFAVTSRLAQPPQGLRAGDPIAVDLIVTGEGNFDSLPAPRPDVAAGWKQYPAKVIQENRGTGLEPGSQVWNQIVTPEAPVTEVPSFVLSFFDPATATYQTVRSAPLPVVVLPAEVAAETRADEAPTKDFSLNDAALPEEKLDDILSLRPTTGAWIPLRSRPHHGVALPAAQTVPAAVLLAFAAIGWKRRHRERREAVARARAGQPRRPAEIRRDLRRDPLSRRQFYTLAREFVEAAEFHTGRPAAAASLNGELDSLLARQALYCYAGVSDEAAAPVPRAEQTETLATLDKLARPAR